jgi:hypothetical protein
MPRQMKLMPRPMKLMPRPIQPISLISLPWPKARPKAMLWPKAGLKAMLWLVAANVSYGADASNAAWVDLVDANKSNDGKFDFCQMMTSSSFPLFALS